MHYQHDIQKHIHNKFIHKTHPESLLNQEDGPNKNSCLFYKLTNMNY